MKAIVIGLGSAGDVHPNVGLALALRQRGHRVLLVAASVFRSLAQRAGLEFAGLGTDDEYYEAIRDPDMWHPFRSFSVVARRLILPSVPLVYETVARHNEPGQTVVAAPGTAFGARIAHEKLGVPLATVPLQPIMLRSTLEPGCFGFPDIIGHLPRPLRRAYLRAVDQFLIDRLLAPDTNAFRAELGLPRFAGCSIAGFTRPSSSSDHGSNGGPISGAEEGEGSKRADHEHGGRPPATHSEESQTVAYHRRGREDVSQTQ